VKCEGLFSELDHSFGESPGHHRPIVPIPVPLAPGRFMKPAFLRPAGALFVWAHRPSQGQGPGLLPVTPLGCVLAQSRDQR